MRKIYLLLLLLQTNFSFSQTDSSFFFKNEFGIDATGTLRFFTQFQNSSDYLYSPTYYLTYRRIFERGNIRFGIGGNASNQERPSPFGDSSIYNYKESSIDTRFGWEFNSNLTKKWQVFYGLDFRFSFGNIKNESAFFNGGYSYGFESHFTSIGIAPILGFRFKINNRISLLTETNFSVNFSKFYNNRDFYIPLAGYPEIPDKTTPDTKSFYTQFSQPISIFFVFNI